MRDFGVKQGISAKKKNHDSQVKFGVVEGKMHDFLFRWGIFIEKRHDFCVKSGIFAKKKRGVIFGLNRGFLKRKCVIFS